MYYLIDTNIRTLLFQFVFVNLLLLPLLLLLLVFRCARRFFFHSIHLFQRFNFSLNCFQLFHFGFFCFMINIANMKPNNNKKLNRLWLKFELHMHNYHCIAPFSDIKTQFYICYCCLIKTNKNHEKFRIYVEMKNVQPTYSIAPV